MWMLFDRVNASICSVRCWCHCSRRRCRWSLFFPLPLFISVHPLHWSVSNSAIIVIAFDNKTLAWNGIRKKMQIKRAPNGIGWQKLDGDEKNKNRRQSVFAVVALCRWHASQADNDVRLHFEPHMRRRHQPPNRFGAFRRWRASQCGGFVWVPFCEMQVFFRRSPDLPRCGCVHASFFFYQHIVWTPHRCITIISVKCSHRAPKRLWNGTIERERKKKARTHCFI